MYSAALTAWLSCFNHVCFFWTPCTLACQAPLSLIFPRQEYWSELSFPTPEDLPDPEIKPMSPTLTGRFFTTSATWEVALDRSPNLDGRRTGKGHFSFHSQRKAMSKNVQTPIPLHSFHILARLWLKFFKLGFSNMWTENFRCSNSI